ncbi:MAG: helix-turn-helix domain-containing protein [Planctomycetes bacterium]|nr:helix-turn-helix domain-containing protein [Planctomycetota bacterium]
MRAMALLHRGHSQSQVARRLGVTRAAVSRG